METDWSKMPEVGLTVPEFLRRVLTARKLAPDAPVSLVIRSEDNEALARQAGADMVINPASFAGLLLASSTHGAHLADYITDLAGCHGTVALRERPVTAQEGGRSRPCAPARPCRSSAAPASSASGSPTPSGWSRAT